MLLSPFYFGDWELLFLLNNRLNAGDASSESI